MRDEQQQISRPNIFASKTSQPIAPTNPVIPQQNLQKVAPVEEMKMEIDSHAQQSVIERCAYCTKGITLQDETQNNVNMFIQTECYHRFHITCFKNYAKSCLTTSKKRTNNSDVEFLDVICKTCNKKVPYEETKEMMSRDELSQIEQTQMDVRIQLDPNMVRCECSALILFEPSRADYNQKDDSGKLLTKLAADHMAQFRVRCSSCQKNFCTSCRRAPYHVGMTCQDAQNN